MTARPALDPRRSQVVPTRRPRTSMPAQDSATAAPRAADFDARRRHRLLRALCLAGVVPVGITALARAARDDSIAEQ